MAGEKLPVQWAVQETAEENTPMGGRLVENPHGQRSAPVIRDVESVNKAWVELQHRKGRECSNCRYFSPATDPDTQAIMAKTHAVELIEKEADIERKYSLPIMQGLCHLETKISFKGGALSFVPPNSFCDNHVPKNRLMAFFGQGRTR